MHFFSVFHNKSVYADRNPTLESFRFVKMVHAYTKQVLISKAYNRYLVGFVLTNFSGFLFRQFVNCRIRTTKPFHAFESFKPVCFFTVI